MRDDRQTEKSIAKSVNMKANRTNLFGSGGSCDYQGATKTALSSWTKARTADFVTGLTGYYEFRGFGLME